MLPLLTQPGTIEGVGLWRWSVTRPGAGGSAGDCFDALAAALLEPAALPALQDPESQDAIRDLASELREHSDSVALRVRDALDHAAREWKIQRCHSLEEKERQLRSSGRSDDADMARQQRERFELPKARLALVVDQLEELFTSGFSPEVRQRYVSRARWFGSERPSLCPGDVTERLLRFVSGVSGSDRADQAGRKIRSAAAHAFRDREHDPVTGRSSRSAIRARPGDGSTPG